MNVSYLKEKMRNMFSLSYIDHRLVEGFMIGSKHTFPFDGKVVGITFIRLAFRLRPRDLHTVSKLKDGGSLGSARRHR